jgi:hypothetical protein
LDKKDWLKKKRRQWKREGAEKRAEVDQARLPQE